MNTFDISNNKKISFFVMLKCSFIQYIKENNLAYSKSGTQITLVLEKITAQEIKFFLF